MSARHDFNAILREARRAGCTVETGRKHMRIVTPSGARISASSSPSDVNAWRMLRSDLRKAGVEV